MILVDDRTGSGDLAPLLSSPNCLVRLDFADFLWVGNGPEGPVNVGIERKSLLDFLNSMVTGRLSGHQLVGLVDFDYPYVLIEGVWRPDRHSGILQRIGKGGRWVAAAQGSRRFMARDVYNYLTTLQVICGVRVVQTSNRWETARWLDSTYRWWQKPWSGHKSHLQWVRDATSPVALSKPNLVARVAYQFEGVGWDRARKLAGIFPDLWSFLGAEAEDLEEVEGIGPKIAASIVAQREEI
jgi:ERCC4-type nuclease